MESPDTKNREIEREFKALELVFNTVKSARLSESNKHPVGDPCRVEIDLNEIDKAHLALLQSRLHATIAEQQLAGMAQTSKENARFSFLVLLLNLVLVVSTVIYTWITWQSVKAMREANQIQQLLQQQQQHLSVSPKGASLRNP